MKNDIYEIVADTLEQQLEIRKLIKKIIHVAENMEIDMYGCVPIVHTNNACKAISELSGVPMRGITRAIHKFGGSCVESTKQTRFKYQNCQEVYFSLMYPTISLNEYGDKQFGKYSLGTFLKCLMKARQTTKHFRGEFSSSLSGKIKFMINMMFRFIARSELEWADEYTKGVPATGRRLISGLTSALSDMGDVYPIHVNTDMVIITSLDKRIDLSEMHDMFEGYKIFADRLDGDVVIFDRTKYVVGKAERFPTAHKMEARSATLTRSVISLTNSVKEQI